MHISRTLARGVAATAASLALVAGGAAVTSADAAVKPCHTKSCDTGWGLKKDTGWGLKKDTGWGFKKDTGWGLKKDTGWG